MDREEGNGRGGEGKGKVAPLPSEESGFASGYNIL